ncbi:PH domain-containing protein [Kitasatospora sp. NBC_00458]|uniref:PH domain-containing protein n=1 Tax=Kitasatospora sp. NBC_00458 TaxID=2903568 RepID=UPI002E18C0FC
MSESADYVSLVLIGTPGVWLTFRVPFCRTVVSSESVIYHGLFATRRVRWEEVANVEKGIVGGALAASYFPVLDLASGKKVELLMLAGYGEENRRVLRSIGVMTELLAGRRGGPGMD